MTDNTCQNDVEEGNAALTSGEYAVALACYMRALDKQPRDARINSKVGVAYYKLHNYTAAIRHLELACELSPKDRDLLYTLGLVYVKAGEKNKALSMYDKLKKLSVDKAEELYKTIYA